MQTKTKAKGAKYQVQYKLKVIDKVNVKIKMKFRHCMIDIETMGTTPNSAIVAIGAVMFDPVSGVIQKTDEAFYRELAWRCQNRRIDPDTQKWWDKQSYDARTCLTGVTSLVDALAELAAWLPKACRVWGNGATFDICILENAYRRLNIKLSDDDKIDIPWKFWNIRDCRTILDMYQSSIAGLGVMGAKEHNALGDAIHQARYVSKMWRKLVGGA